jgi:RNA polymerase sigma factor (sigma-70 family)
MNAARNLQVNSRRSVGIAAGRRRARRSDAVIARLVNLAAKGDQYAWNELVEEFGGLVWATARSYRLSHADADEVSQTTWLRLFENLDRLHDPAHVGAWLATTARRECIQQLRRASRVIPTDDVPEQVSESAAPDAALLANECDHALWSALADLPDRDGRLLRMLIADPAPSYADISEALQMPIGSIGPTRARALQRLRRKLGARGLHDLSGRACDTDTR